MIRFVIFASAQWRWSERKRKLLLNCYHYFGEFEMWTGNMKRHLKARPYWFQAISCLVFELKQWAGVWEKHKISGKYGHNRKTINLMRWERIQSTSRVQNRMRRIIRHRRKRKTSPLRYVILTTSSNPCDDDWYTLHWMLYVMRIRE